MTVYDLPGISLSVAATSPRIEKALKNIFKECPLAQTPPDVALKGSGVKHNDFVEHLPSWIVSRLPDLKPNMTPVILYGPSQQAAALGTCDDLIFCAWNSKHGNEINFICTVNDNEYAYGLFHPVLIPVLREVYLQRGFFMLHSAGIRCPDGTGALIIAVSGGGKTTTTLSMIRQGAGLLSDDLIILKPSSDSTQAGGIPKALNLHDETISFYDELKRLPDSSFVQQHKEKKSVSPTRIYGKECLCSDTDIHVIYFVKISAAGPYVKPLPVAESLKRLALAHGFTYNQKLEAQSIKGLTLALQHANAYELSTGPDPIKLGTWLLEHCTEHAQ